MGGWMSVPKTRTPIRRSPRKGPNPSPWRRAASTPARQSTSTPSALGRIFQLRPAARNSTGTWRRRSARRSSRVRASAASSPLTGTPATRAPAGSFAVEPAKANPRRTPAPTSTVATSRDHCQTRRLRGLRLRDRRGRWAGRELTCSGLYRRSWRPLFEPVNTPIVIRNLDPAAVRVAHIEALRPRRVGDGLAHDGVHGSCALERLVEAHGVDVERDLVRVLGERVRLRLEEDEQRRARAQRLVRAVQRLGAQELGVERAQARRIGRAERDVVDAEDAHAAQRYASQLDADDERM